MAITVDQALVSTGTAASTTNPWNTTTTATVASAAYIVLGINWFGTPTVSSVTFGGSAGTVIVQGKSGSGDSTALLGFYATSGLASGSTISVSLSAGLVDATRGSMSFLGVDSTTPVSGTTGPTANASTTWATASSTLAAGGALIATAFQEGFSTTNNTPASGTIEAYDTAFDGNGNVLVYRIEAAGGSFTLGGTWTAGTGPGGNVAAILNPAGGGPAPYPFELLTQTPRSY